MNNYYLHRKKLIHLYNPKKEGLGSYDLNYINANKKGKNENNKQTRIPERYAA